MLVSYPHLPTCGFWAWLSVSEVRNVCHHPIIDLTQSHPPLPATRNGLKWWNVVCTLYRCQGHNTSLPVLWGRHRTGFPRGSSSRTLSRSPHSPRSPRRHSPRWSPGRWWPPPPPRPSPRPPHWRRPAAEDSASSQCCRSETWESKNISNFIKLVF